jgi:TonB family protein
MKWLGPSNITILLLVCVFAQAQERPSDLPVRPDGVNTTNQTITDIARSADVAMQSRDYDRAIQLCEQGIAMAPKQFGFWGNKSLALIRRALVNHSRGLHSDDPTQRKQLVEAARSDIRAALEASDKSLDLWTKLPEPTDPARIADRAYNKVKVLQFQAESTYFMTILVDESYASRAVTAINEYVAVTADPEKTLAQLHLGEMFIRIRKFREAIDAYQKILISDSRNADANLGAAVSLINLGFETNEKTSLERGFEFLDIFVTEASEKHAIRGSAEQALKYIRGPKSEISFYQPTSQPSESKSVVAGGVVNGKALKLPPPSYPAVAEFARVRGVIHVRVLIDEEGNVTKAVALSGHPLLQAVAVEAALNAKFSATTLSGQPMKVFGTVVYNFVEQ